MTMPSKKKGSCKERTKNFFLFLYNPRRKLCCNKTCRQWGKNLTFNLSHQNVDISYPQILIPNNYLVAQYFLYYGGFYCLIMLLFIVLSTMVLWNFARFDIPLEQFKILTKPALSVRPTMVRHVVAYNENSNTVLVEQMKNFYREYENFNPDRYQDCSATTEKNKQCFFNLTELGPCGVEPFGYDGKHLCIFLKINKVYGWTPKHGKSLEKSHNLLTDPSPRKSGFLEVTCKPLKPLDKENLKEIQLFPEHGFPEYFFPFIHKRSYLSPLVAVYFSGLTTDLLITVVCQAKGYSWKESTAFEIMIGNSSIISYEIKQKIV